LEGVTVVDKPAGLSSAGVVNRVKRLLGAKRAGHTGTLDPFATGVLAVCLSGATKAIPYMDEAFKEYEAVLRLGVLTDTLDSTGKVIEQCPVEGMGEGRVLEALEGFRGKIEQTPPKYSAIKKNGRRMYWLARHGVEVERPKREVFIEDLRLLGLDLPDIRLFIRCSRGTYIRSLGADIAERLGCCGHVAGLRRLKSGIFDIEDAASIEELQDGNYKLFSIRQVLSHLKDIEVGVVVAARIRDGLQVKKCFVDGLSLPDFIKGERLVVTDGGRVVSVVEAVVGAGEVEECGDDDTVLKLLRVFGGDGSD